MTTFRQGRDTRINNADIVVIGGGPAGLSAARQAALQGLKVLLVDEQPSLGGRLHAQHHTDPRGGVWDGSEVAHELAKEAISAGVLFASEASAWSLEANRAEEIDGGQIIATSPWLVPLYQREIGVTNVSASALVLATGSRQAPVAFPGWTLPGVVTAGAAQTFIQQHGVIPGRNAIIVGVDLLSLQVGEWLLREGCTVYGVVIAPKMGANLHKSQSNKAFQELVRLAEWAPSRVTRFLGRVASTPRLNNLAFRLFPRRGITANGLRLMPTTMILEAVGDKSVTHVRLCDLDVDGRQNMNTYREIPVDLVCTSAGLLPLTELASLAGCDMAFEPSLGGFVPIHSPKGQTTVDGIFVAGSMAGVDTAREAIRQGRVAGNSAANYLINKTNSGEPDYELAEDASNSRGFATLPPFANGVAEARARVYKEWERRRGVKRVAS